MSRIDDLIREHCPGGVEYRRLSEMGQWFGGGTPAKSRAEYWKDGTIPWLSPKDMAGELVLTTEDKVSEAALISGGLRQVPAMAVALVVRSNILRRRLPTALVVPSVTLNQDVRAVSPDESVLAEFLAQMLHAHASRILGEAGRMAGSMAAVESARLMEYRLPVPPIEVQHEVVSILRDLQSLEVELEARLRAELDARRHQYVHYRDRILSFPEINGGGGYGSL